MKQIKKDLQEIKKEVDEEKEEIGLATEIIQDYKKDNRKLEENNKRLFIIWLVTFIAFIGLLGYTIYLLNDIGTAETTTKTYTQDINDTGDIDNSTINNGGVINGKN